MNKPHTHEDRTTLEQFRNLPEPGQAFLDHLYDSHTDLPRLDTATQPRLIEQHDAEHFTESIQRQRPGAPTLTDRIEAHHWVICLAESAQDFGRALYNWEKYPAGSGSVEHWQADLIHMREYLENAISALAGKHTRGGSSLLESLEPAETRTPDTRPVAERKRTREGD
jgi:hypothetical protein